MHWLAGQEAVLKFDPDLHHRCSQRLRGFAYAAPGTYCVTVCVQGRERLFGQTVEGEMVLSEAGRMVEEVWRSMPVRFPTAILDEFVVMPDHFHAIVILTDPAGVGAPLVGAHGSPVELITRAGTRPAPTLGDVIGAFKSMTTNAYLRGVEHNHWPPFPGRLWQRNYHDRIIRDDAELQRVREYIAGNPVRWAEDAEHPGNVQTRAGTRPAPA